MIEGIWTGHTGGVRSLSWSPSGDNIASGSNDGTILIRKAGSGDVEVEPIESKQAWVLALAYSPSGDRIASGGSNKTLCIWDSKTGQLVVDPVEGLGTSVTSIAWSLDSTKLYAASDNFARVFDSSITWSRTLQSILSHFHQNTIYSCAWVAEALLSYGTRCLISHLASHFNNMRWIFVVHRSLKMGGTWCMADMTVKFLCG